MAEFTRQGHAALLAQEVKEGDRAFTRSLDVRYRGQEHTLALELAPGERAADIEDRFHTLHQSSYGHAMPEPAEILALRVRAVGQLPKPSLPPIARAVDPAVPFGFRTAYDLAGGATKEFGVYDRHALLAGHEVAGPAIVEEGTATAVIFGDQRLAVDGYGQLLITSSTDQEGF
jgi:N-methylhydantoinase A